MQNRFVLQAALLMAALPAGALHSAAAAADVPVQAPAVPYQSVFSDYQSFKEPDLASWREVNEEVARAGGHVGIVGGAGGHGAQGTAKPLEPAAKAAPPAAAQQPARGALEAPGHDAHHR